MKIHIPNIFTKLQIPAVLYTLLIAVYFTCALNIALLLKLYGIIGDLQNVKIGFVISIFFFFVAAFNVIFTLFSTKYIEKPFFVILISLSSLVSYAMYQYGIIFDPDMITNIAETDVGEATSYLNLYSVLWFVFLGLIPAFLLYKVKITRTTFRKEVLYRTASVISSFAVIGIIALLYYVDYASVARNNSYIRKMIVPTYYLTSTYKYVNANYFTEPIEYKKIGLDAQHTLANKEDSKKNLMVFIVGETARSMNYELNGYDRPTNQYTKNIKALNSFQKVSSCGTATAISVPCMFSILERKEYSKRIADNQDNILDVLKRAGINVLWLENNSSCKGVCKNVKMIDVRKKYNDNKKYCSSGVCLDEAFLPLIKEQIDLNKDGKNDQIIVLHIMGSHGPTYYKRFPKEHKYFKPSCDKSDIQNCSREEILNVYDNTILYTDYIISQIIDILKSSNNDWNTSLLYMSDHGESLGEKGLYLHGMPYAMAPSEQTHIPFISWFSDDVIVAKNINKMCIKNIAENNTYSHDNLFHTLLGFMGVSTNIYKKDMDIFYKCSKSGS